VERLYLQLVFAIVLKNVLLLIIILKGKGIEVLESLYNSSL